MSIQAFATPDINGVVSYEEFKKRIPQRRMFIDPVKYAAISTTLQNTETVLFLPSYVYETSMQDAKFQKAHYKIILIGVLTDGRKMSVIIDNIEPYFEVRIPHPTDPIDDLLRGPNYNRNEYIAELRNKLSESEYTRPDKTTIMKSRPFKYFRQDASEFIRFYYKKLKNRVAAIKIARDNNYETATDDISCYYRVVCRDNLSSFSTWSALSDYKLTTNENIKGQVIRVDIKNYKPYTGPLNDELMKDKTMSVSWDIETWSPSGDIPTPENRLDKIFCIGLTYQWVNVKEPFLKIAICDVPAAPRKDYLTVVCGNETNVIKCFADSFAGMQPEFIFGFNDSDYDWRWLITRASMTPNLLSYVAERFDSSVPFAPNNDPNAPRYIDANILKFNYKKEHIKVEADTYVDGSTLMMHGYIPVDVRTTFRKLYPTAEQSSLKWFLSKNKLGGKEDMPIHEMFDIYNKMRELANKPGVKADLTGKSINYIIDQAYPDLQLEYNILLEKVADINKYCMVDARRCHDLVTIRSVIMDHREVANLAYVTMFDAFYRANGMKVRNLTIAVGQKAPFNIRFTNIGNTTIEDGKYPGAYVFPPRKGLKISKLSIAERIKKAQLTKDSDEPACQEWLDTTDSETKDYYQIVEKFGPNCDLQQFNEILANEKKLDPAFHVPKRLQEFIVEPTGRPIIGLDFSSLYPSLIRCYNFSPEYCIKDTKLINAIRASGQKLTKVEFDFNGTRRTAQFIWHNNKLSPSEDGFQFGVYPYILDDLFNKRAGIKKLMKPFAKRLEVMNDHGADYIKQNQDEFDDTVFNVNYFNSKQNALKVYMNTFYGEAGNQLSPFFVLELAGGITDYGKKNIKMAQQTVKEMGCGVYYGDSVTADTPVFIRRNNKTSYERIDNLAHNYQQYNNGKEISILSGCEIWSDAGWTNVKHVIKHQTNKKIYRIMTMSSYIDVTEDHSLLDINGNPIKPMSALGQKLLISEHPIYTDTKSINVNPLINLLNGLKASNTNYSLYEDNNVIRVKHTQVPLTDDEKRTVISVKEISYDGPVYDIETENHHFAAGVGNIVAHNTDSLYLSVPEKAFTLIDMKYYLNQMSKIDYWTQLVEISFKEINDVRDTVNTMFFNDNQTKFLSMAYEEVLYPVAFTAKKKYFGKAHENIASFVDFSDFTNAKHIFIRGLEVKKRGVSGLLRDIFNEIMCTALNINNLYSLLEIVHNKINEIYKRQWNLQHFIQTDVYRPSKNNVKIQTFVARMKEEGVYVKPNERFEYIIVKKYPYAYDYRGRKSTLSVGDKIEFKERALEQGLEVDLDHYMSSSINGQLGRLITYHNMFYVEPLDNTENELKEAEKKIYANACKYVDNYCKKYYADYNTFGKAYQAVFKTANKLVGNQIKTKDDLLGKLLSSNVDIDKFEQWILELTRKVAEQRCYGYGQAFIENELNELETTHPDNDKATLATIKANKIQTLQRVYYGIPHTCIYDVRERMYRETISVVCKHIRESLKDIISVYKIYHKGVENIINLVKDKMSVGIIHKQPRQPEMARDYKLTDFGELDELVDENVLSLEAITYTESMFADPKVVAILQKFKGLYGSILALQINITRTRSIVDYLKILRNRSVHAVVTPDASTMQDFIKQGIEEAMMSDIRF